MTKFNLRNLVQLDKIAKFMKQGMTIVKALTIQGMTIVKALTILNRQMKVSGLRERAD